MSTIKITNLAGVPTLNANTQLTVFVGVDLSTGITSKFTANTIQKGLFADGPVIFQDGSKQYANANYYITVANTWIQAAAIASANVIAFNSSNTFCNISTITTGTQYIKLSPALYSNTKTYANNALSFNAANGALSSGSVITTNNAPSTIAGSLFIANTQTSNSNTSGALVVNGGVGIQGNVHISGSLVMTGMAAYSNAAPTIASIGTIAPTKAITFITGTTAISVITPPQPIAFNGGQLTLIPTGVWTTNTAGNIALASTAVVSKAMIMTYDATTNKWYPSY